MNSRENSDMPPAPSYPSPNAAQMGQGTMPYYSNRQLTEDELLSAELSRDASGPGLADSAGNAVHHGQSMVLGSGGAELGRASSADQHHQEHMLQFTPSQQVGVDPNHDLSYGDQSARRKRSKISRACDECRRKKVRCDASSESGVEACSNCRRLGVTCQFSRVPMKRGPSKGYIKELAERLHTLENQMQPGMTSTELPYHPMDETSPAPARDYHGLPSPLGAGSLSRKRTFSVFEGLPNSSFTQPLNSRSSQHAFDTPGAIPDHENQTMAHNQAPMGANLFWLTSHGYPDGVTLEDSKQPSAEEMTPLSVDEESFAMYHEKIHPFVPILTRSKEKLLALMHQSTREVQEVFLHAFYRVTHSDPGRVSSVFQKVKSFESAQDLLLHHCRNPPMAPVTASNIITMQTMLLMIIDADSRGPDNLVLGGGVQKQTLLYHASKFSRDLAKICGELPDTHTMIVEPDLDVNIVRRCRVMVIILSRWHSIGFADAGAMISDEIISRKDVRLFESGPETISTYTTFLNDLITIVAEHPDICQADPALGRVLGNNLLGNLERLHWKHINITENMTQEEACIFPFVESLTDQLYLTLKLLMKRHVFVYSPYEIIFSAKELMDVMHKATIEDRLATPLDIHSLALAAMTLLESTINPVFAGECWESLKKLDEILEYRHARSSSAREFDGILSTPGWDYKLRVFVEWRRSQAQTSHHNSADVAGAGAGAGATVAGPAPVGPNEQRSLQHLADLAVGAEDTVGANASPPPPENGMDSSPKPPNRHSPYDGMVVDYTFLTHRGYLSVLSGVAFPRHPRPSST